MKLTNIQQRSRHNIDREEDKDKKTAHLTQRILRRHLVKVQRGPRHTRLNTRRLTRLHTQRHILDHQLRLEPRLVAV